MLVGPFELLEVGIVALQAHVLRLHPLHDVACLSQ